MERLIKIDSDVGSALEALGDEFYRIPNNQFDAAVEFILSQIGKQMSDAFNYEIERRDEDDQPEIHKYNFELYPYVMDELNQLVILIGKNKFVQLMRTIKDVAELSKKKGYHFDLHEGNFMHRHDGVPVIVDPWVTDSYRSVGKMSRGYK
jgi:hypothetical protein